MAWFLQLVDEVSRGLRRRPRRCGG